MTFYASSVTLEDEKIITHPMARRKLKLFEEKRPPRPLLEDERIRLLAACDLDPKFSGFPAVIITAINTGMRLSELLHLKWDAVDLESRIITVVKSKSKKPRYIPMNRLVHAALSSLERPDEYVFRIDHTGDVKAKFEHKWADLRQLAGLPAVKFKNLRATFATRLTDRKVSVRVGQALLGHSTPVVTERYIRVDKSLEDAVSTLEVGQNLGQNSDGDLDEDP